MSGAPTPPVIVEAFAISGTKTNPIPTASQVAIDIARASLATGFPDATMTPLASGGKPPYGSDMNGILYMLSAHIVALQAGQPYTFNSTLSTQLTGYAIGAILSSASVPGKYFYNTTAGNTNDPDSVITGWIPFTPTALGNSIVSTAPAAGTFNDVAVAIGTAFLEVTPSGAAIYTGFTAGMDGQLLTVTNLHATNTLTLNKLIGSVAANQLRLPANITLLQYQHITFRYNLALALWIPIS